MIDSSKKQQQGFQEILPVGDIKLLKEKECLEAINQKSLKEGQFHNCKQKNGMPMCNLRLWLNGMG